MADYLSTSSLKISDKSDDGHNDLKNSTSTSAITSSLKHKDKALSLEDVASNTLTSFFSETVEHEHHQRNVKTPVHWLLTLQQNASNASSSNQVGPNFQRRSITHRHLPPYPPLSRQGITDIDAFKPVRKTRSMTFPTTAVKNVSWCRDETASNLELKIDQYRTECASISPRRNIRWKRIYGMCTLMYNMHSIGITLDCIISVTGLIHVALVIALAIHKDIILTVVKQEVYTLIKTGFIIVSLLLLVFPITALYFLHKGHKRRAMHAAGSLIVAIIILFFASIQNKVENNILINIDKNMPLMINSETRYFPSSTWDKFHETFKCCGAKGNLDWCQKEELDKNMNSKIDKFNSMNFIGFYICHIPKSCCASSINEYNVSTITGSQESCLLLPTPWNTYRPGCITPLKLEIFSMNKLYRVLCFTTVAVLLLSMTTSIFLCTFP